MSTRLARPGEARPTPTSPRASLDGDNNDRGSNNDKGINGDQGSNSRSGSDSSTASGGKSSDSGKRSDGKRSSSAKGGDSRGRRGTPATHVLLGTVVAIAAGITALLVGAEHLAPADLLAVVRGQGSPEATALVLDYRLPRSLIALLVGGALAVAGALIQALTRNPLADPGILGVNAGAALAVTVAIGQFGVTATSALVWPALAGAALATLSVVALGGTGRGPATPLRMTLAGVALAAFLSGVNTGLRLVDPDTFDRYRAWAAGSVAGRSLGDLTAVVPFVAVGLLCAVLVARPLNAIAMGDDVAASLGTRVATTRTVTVLAVALLAGGATAVAGPIAFVGLMVPHAVRWIVGPDQRRIIAVSIPVGALLLLCSDILARVLLGGAELPVGVVTAFVGSPVLIALVRRRKVSGL